MREFAQDGLFAQPAIRTPVVVSIPIPFGTTVGTKVPYYINTRLYHTPPVKEDWIGREVPIRVTLEIHARPKRNVEGILARLEEISDLSTGPGILIAQHATEEARMHAVQTAPMTMQGQAALRAQLEDLCKLHGAPPACIAKYMQVFRDACHVKLTLRLNGYLPVTQSFSMLEAEDMWNIPFTMTPDGGGRSLPTLRTTTEHYVNDMDSDWVMRLEVEHRGKRVTIYGEFGSPSLFNKSSFESKKYFFGLS